MFLGLSSRNSDNLPVDVSGYTPIAQFRENTSIRFQLLSFLSIQSFSINYSFSIFKQRNNEPFHF